MKPVLEEAKLLLKALASDEFVPTDRLTQLARQARSSAEQLDPKSQREVMATINKLVEAMGAHTKRTKTRLNQLQANRRSLKKFGHLRTHAIGQRYYNSI
jgi:hypothetical protein